MLKTQKNTRYREKQKLTQDIQSHTVYGTIEKVYWKGFFLFALALLMTAMWATTGFAASKQMRGKASWYGTTAHGKVTASGETFNRYLLTAAHKKLPFGTIIRVYNTRNGKQSIVRINDRGPFSKGRVVDVSMRSGEHLGMKATGVAPVVLEIIGTLDGRLLNPDNSYYLHLKTEVDAQKAHALSASFQKRLKKEIRALQSKKNGEPVYVLCVGPYETFQEVQKDLTKFELKKLFSQGIIEAPTKGGTIPVRKPPFDKKKGAHQAKPAGKQQAKKPAK